MGFEEGNMSVPAPVGSAYCVSESTRFVMDQKMECCGRLSTIRDAQGNIVFSEKKKTIRNASDEPVASVKAQLFSKRSKWKAYGGNDLLFTMVRSAFFQWKASYDIFLPGNNSSSPDFTVKGDHSKHNLTVYYGDVTIAEVQRKGKRQSFFVRTDEYDISVRSGIDYAFIHFVVIIIEKIREAERQAAAGSSASSSAASSVAAAS